MTKMMMISRKTGRMICRMTNGLVPYPRNSQPEKIIVDQEKLRGKKILVMGCSGYSSDFAGTGFEVRGSKPSSISLMAVFK